MPALSAMAGIGQAATAVEDAAKMLGSYGLQWLSWPQQWPNSGCGFGGIVQQAFCVAQTLVASNTDGRVLVYHKGRFAYEVKTPTDDFWEACGQSKLPGKKDWASVRGKYDSSLEE